MAVPAAVNEPVRSYAPGTPERADLEARLDSMSQERIEIPVVIGGERNTTGLLETVVMPHAHGHVLADWHRACNFRYKPSGRFRTVSTAMRVTPKLVQAVRQTRTTRSGTTWVFLGLISIAVKGRVGGAAPASRPAISASMSCSSSWSCVL